VRKVGVFEDNFLRYFGLTAGSLIAGQFKHYPVVVQSHGVSKIGFQFFPDGHVARFNHLQKNTSAQLHSFSRTGAGSASPLSCAALDRLSNRPFTFFGSTHGALFLVALSTQQYSLKF